MSKSTLATEVEALQGNTAFLSEFLDVPLFELNNTIAEIQQTSETPIPKKETALAPDSPAVPILKTVTPTATASPETVAVLPKVVMPKVAVPLATPKKSYDGKYVIWTLQKPLPEERLLIKKIIEAVGIPAANLILETEMNAEANDWSSTPFVFAFGVEMLKLPLNQTVEWQGTRLLNTHSLAELSTNVNHKKSLWLALKLAFKL